MLGPPVPVACLTCRGHKTVRVVWGATAVIHGLWAAKIDEVVAVVGGHRPEGAPDWACLSCQPRWVEVHRLGLQEEECQAKKEDGAAAADFVAAGYWLDQQRLIGQQLQRLLSELQGGKSGFTL